MCIVTVDWREAFAIVEGLNECCKQREWRRSPVYTVRMLVEVSTYVILFL